MRWPGGRCVRRQQKTSRMTPVIGPPSVASYSADMTGLLPLTGGADDTQNPSRWRSGRVAAGGRGAAAGLLVEAGIRQRVPDAAVPRHARRAPAGGDCRHRQHGQEALRRELRAVPRRGRKGRRVRRAVPGAAAARLHRWPVQVQDDRGGTAADRRRSVPHDLARGERHRHAAVEVLRRRTTSAGRSSTT